MRPCGMPVVRAIAHKFDIKQFQPVLYHNSDYQPGFDPVKRFSKTQFWDAKPQGVGYLYAVARFEHRNDFNAWSTFLHNPGLAAAHCRWIASILSYKQFDDPNKSYCPLFVWSPLRQV